MVHDSTSRFTHAVACARVSFLFKAEEYSMVCTRHIPFVHSSADGCEDCFCTGVIVNNTATDIAMHVPSMES